MLAFVPGRREIGRASASLEQVLGGGVEVLALHGELPVEQQSRVLQPGDDGRRRVVLATNVAESSVTLPGVRVVIDGGLAREPRFDPNSGFARLDAVALHPVAGPITLVLLSVFMMRWNVVIGGQELAKTGQGLLEYGVPGLHFYSLNKSRSVCAIHENLNLGALTKAPA